MNEKNKTNNKLQLRNVDTKKRKGIQMIFLKFKIKYII